MNRPARWAERGLIHAIPPEHLLLFMDAAPQTYPTLAWQIAPMSGVSSRQDLHNIAPP